MQPPPLPNIDIQPFLESISFLEKQLASCAGMATSPEDKKMFDSLLHTISTSKAEFENVIPASVAAGRQEYSRLVGELNQLEASKQKFDADCDVFYTKCQTLRDTINNTPPFNLPDPPRPRGIAPKSTIAAPLLDGNTLRSFLLGLRDPAEEALQGPRTTGNIWDNWKPGDTGGKPRA